MNIRIVELTIRLSVELPENMTEDELRYSQEEHNCVGNLIDQIHGEMVEGVCNECQRATVKLLPEGSRLFF